MSSIFKKLTKTTNTKKPRKVTYDFHHLPGCLFLHFPACSHCIFTRWDCEVTGHVKTRSSRHQRQLRFVSDHCCFRKVALPALCLASDLFLRRASPGLHTAARHLDCPGARQLSLCSEWALFTGAAWARPEHVFFMTRSSVWDGIHPLLCGLDFTFRPFYLIFLQTPYEISLKLTMRRL